MFFFQDVVVGVKKNRCQGVTMNQDLITWLSTYLSQLLVSNLRGRDLEGTEAHSQNKLDFIT